MIRNDKVDTQNSQPSQNMKSSGSTTNLKNINIVGRPPKKKNLNYLFSDEFENDNYAKIDPLNNNDDDDNSNLNYDVHFKVKDSTASPIKPRSEAGTFNSEKVDNIWSNEINNGYYSHNTQSHNIELQSEDVS